MLDPVKEAHDLNKADADIRRATKVLLAQERIVRGLVAHDHDASGAQQLLDTMRKTLDILDAHRTQIVRNLADIEAARHKGGAAATDGRQPPAQPAGGGDLARAQYFLDEYRRIRQLSQAARREMLETRDGLRNPMLQLALERLRTLGQSEHQALQAYIDEVEQCAAHCDWLRGAARPKGG